MEKEVYYYQYCKVCKYEHEDENKGEHCCYCLCEPSNTDSHKPIMFKKKEEAYS